MQKQVTITPQEIAEYLYPARQKICDDWFVRMRDIFQENTPIKLSFLHANWQKGEDLFSVVLNRLKEDWEEERKIVAYDATFRKIRSLDYSISDFFKEVSCLERCLQDFLISFAGLNDRQVLDGMTLVKKVINEITTYLLEECAEVFEYVVETSKCSFCQTNKDGQIVFANRAMEKLIGDMSLRGKYLIDYFEMDDQQMVRDALLHEAPPEGNLLHLTLISSDNNRFVVGAEVGAIIIGGQYKGGYAHLTDMTSTEHQHRQIYDRSALGIVNLNLHGDILYANSTMLQMLNLKDYERMNVNDILPDNETKNLVRAQLGSRLEWKSDEYEIELLRGSDRVRVPVMIFAFPQTDLSGRYPIGSFAIIRSLVGDRIHAHIENNHNEKELLESVMTELSLVIPYDRVAVAKYSSDRKFACSIFGKGLVAEQGLTRRWWKLSTVQMKIVQNNEPLLVNDLGKYLEKPELKHLKEEPDLKMLLGQGLHGVIFFPIIQDGQLVAAVTLWSKSQDAFNEYHLRELQRLPVKSAVYMALYYNRQREKNVITDLITKLNSVGSDLESVAQVIVAAVSEYFQRPSISIFKFNRRHNSVHLIAQAATASQYTIDPGYEQSVQEGVLGYVCQKRQVVNIGNIDHDKQFRESYKNPFTGVKMQSELCLPISFGGALWLLNIEDELIDAFSREEQIELTDLMKEVERSLAKTWMSRFFEASLELSSDIVLVVDYHNQIIQINPMADAMLDISAVTPNFSQKLPALALRQIEPVALRDIFIVPEIADTILQKNRPPISSTKLKRRGGGILPVVLTIVDLMEDFGHTIFFATDLTVQQRIEEISSLGTIYRELAVQTRTPLSLAQGWLMRLRERLADPVLENIVDTSLRQLKKLELTYDRVVMYAEGKTHLPFNPILLNVGEVINAVRGSLPRSEQNLVDWPHYEVEMPVWGDLLQLRFCFETILSYLLRFTQEKGGIELLLDRHKDQVVITITGWFPETPSSENIEMTRAIVEAHAVADLAFGESFIHHILEVLHKGRFIVFPVENAQGRFIFELPIYEGGQDDS